MRKITNGFITLLLISFSIFAIAHERDYKKTAPVNPETKSSLEEINEQYLKDIKPFFQKKCFDCHSSQTQFPWYQKIPGVKQWIQKDIEEAKTHLDMDSDFPFKSHATPIEDLEAIDKSISSNEMPPLRYRILHSDSALSDEEKEQVHQWVEFGKEKLKQSIKP